MARAQSLQPQPEWSDPSWFTKLMGPQLVQSVQLRCNETTWAKQCEHTAFSFLPSCIEKWFYRYTSMLLLLLLLFGLWFCWIWQLTTQQRFHPELRILQYKNTKSQFASKMQLYRHAAAITRSAWNHFLHLLTSALGNNNAAITSIWVGFCYINCYLHPSNKLSFLSIYLTLKQAALTYTHT